MKNSEKHNGLDQANIRDFLGAKASSYGYLEKVERIRAEIKRLNEDLKKAMASEAAIELIVQHGWDMHDVSDAIEDYEYNTYFPFIGTAEEMREAIKDG